MLCAIEKQIEPSSNQPSL